MKKLRTLKRSLLLPYHCHLALRRLTQFHSRPRTLEEIADAAIDLGTKGFVQIRAVQKRPEILALVRAVAELKPAVIVEIGTHKGGTLFIWSHLASQLAVGCDLQHAPYRYGIYRRFAPPGSACRVVPLAGNSHDPAFVRRLEGVLAGRPVDFMLIDGDHSAEGVKADYEMYRHLVRPGGLIAFHDILEKQPFPETQVWRFWRQLRDELPTEEFVDDPTQCGYGIGLVRVDRV